MHHQTSQLVNTFSAFVEVAEKEKNGKEKTSVLVPADLQSRNTFNHAIGRF